MSVTVSVSSSNYKMRFTMKILEILIILCNFLKYILGKPKKVLLMAQPLRGGGGKGLVTKKNADKTFLSYIWSKMNFRRKIKMKHSHHRFFFVNMRTKMYFLLVIMYCNATKIKNKWVWFGQQMQRLYQQYMILQTFFRSRKTK